MTVGGIRLRTLIFWPHLVAGVLAGIVILIMAVTGALLTYERQLVAWTDRGFRSTPVPPGTPRLPIETLVDRFRQARPEATPTNLTFRAAPDAPVTISAEQRTFYVDAYSGAVLGEGSPAVRRAMSALRAWHRWLAVQGDGRPIARAITGWSNLIFLFIVVSGLYLWFPRKWSWQHVKPVLLFRGGLRGKTRDFNWHNVVGAWCALVLFVVVLGAVPISFPWANALVYRVVGEDPPVPGGGRAAGPRRTSAAPRAARGSEPGSGDARVSREREREGSNPLAGLDALWTQAERQVHDWKTIGVRLPTSADAPVTFAIDRGDGGQPHLRSTLTLHRATGAAVTYETFADQSLGRRVRSFLRFAHTGEAFGIAGQTAAGLASAGGAVLVWTGLALAWRRFRAWATRRASLAAPRTAVATPSTDSAGSQAAGLLYGEKS